MDLEINVKKPECISMIFITIAVVIQIGLVITTFILPLRSRILGVRDLSMIERSAVLAFGDDFAAYLDFVTRNVPLESTVVLPPRTVDYRWGDVSLMQFYLAPRRLSNCPAEDEAVDCVRSRIGPKTYLIAIDGFPPSEVVGELESFVPFDESRGLFIPH